MSRGEKQEERGYSTHKLNPVTEAVRGLQSKLVRIREVVERAGWNGWIQLKDANDDVWKWIEDVGRLEKEIVDELEKRKLEIAKAVGEDPSRAVKVLHSIPCVRSCIKPDVKVQNPGLLNTIKGLSEKAERGFKDDDVKRFNDLAYPDSESAARNERPATSCELSVKPVRGQESYKNHLIDHLLTAAPRFISIEGPDGWGKTTVARMVYNDGRVGAHFKVRKWVCVASDLSSCEKRVRRECDAQNLLRGKRFLLVLDDIDNDMKWYPFCDSLLDQGASGSTILITTKFNVYPYFSRIMSRLSTSDCWSIMKRTALQGKPHLHRQVRGIGRNLASGCKGLPGAAKIMGDYLKSKETAQEWEEACSDGILQLKTSRLLYRDEFIVYDTLSPALKQCFSYCAVFPKDCHISVERIVALWEALGHAGDKMLDDLHKLIVRLTSFEKVWDFYILTKVTESIHRNRELTCKYTNKNYYDVARYVAPELTMSEQLKSLSSGQSQSLIKCLVILSPCELPKDLFRRLKSVKALVLSSCQLEQLSDEVGSLDLLEFLDLSGNPLKKLPETMGDLKSLKSLHLHSCYLLLSLPDSIGNLGGLQNLRINHTADELHNLPQGFEKLTSMRTLDVFRAGGTYENIGKLKNLNHLVDIRISVHGEVRFSDAALESKSEVVNMELCFVGNGRDQKLEPCVEKLVPPPNLEMLLIEDYHGLKLPMWSFINKLKRLSLRSAVNISTLPAALWKLSSLEFLWLYDMPKITHLGCEFFGLVQSSGDDEGEEFYSSEDEDGGISDEEFHNAFRSLKTLRIEYLESWETWGDVDELYEKQIKVMPSLEELIISNCPKLQVMPFRILKDTCTMAQGKGLWSAAPHEISDPQQA